MSSLPHMLTDGPANYKLFLHPYLKGKNVYIILGIRRIAIDRDRFQIFAKLICFRFVYDSDFSGTVYNDIYATCRLQVACQ